MAREMKSVGLLRLFKKCNYFGVLSLLFVLVFTNFVRAGWNIQTIDSAGNLGGARTSISLDTSDRPHISYYDDTNGDLKYARWAGSSWDIRTVDSGGDVGWEASIALDGSGYPHISYKDRINGDLKYAKWTGSSWSIQTVDSAGNVGDGSSIALDGSGNPHISYHHWDNGGLKYAKWTGSSWSIQTLDSVGGSGGIDTSIALDGSGYPHISYFDLTNGYLKYAKWTGSSWSIQVVDGAAGAANSIALDGSGNPHISYYDFDNGDLKYARWTGSSWIIQTVDSAGSVGSYTSIALDVSGNPHISYRDLTNGDLKYAKWTGSSWSIQTVDSVGNVGYRTSLALNGNGNPCISYIDGTNGNLKYAKWIQPDLLITNIDAPSSATERDIINVSNTVKNQGDTSAGSFYIYFYLSPDTTITTSDTKIGERYVSSLSATASSSANTSCTLPSGVTGSYYVGAIVDATGSVSESNENNNTGYDPTPINISPAPPGPDLVVISIDAPNSAIAGESVNVWNTIKNGGDAPASSFYIYFYLSTNTTITPSDTKIGERYVSNLSAGASSGATSSLTLPSGVTGSYYVGAIVDATGSVSESNENNNGGHDPTPIEINHGPIIQVSRSSLDFGEIPKGETCLDHFTISNSGAGTLSGTITIDRAWISVDPVSFESNYVTIWVTVYTDPLEVWKTYTGTITIDSNGGTEAVTVKIVPTCVKTYPNPYRLSSGKPLTFWGTGVPHATIKIYTLSGELVRTLKETRGEDRITWDGRNEDRERITRGLYFFTTKNPREKNKGKFTVVR